MEEKMRRTKLKIILMVSLIILILSGNLLIAYSHFGMIIPSDDMVTMEDEKNIQLGIKFMHPMEGDYMNMEKPIRCGLMIQGEKIDLLNNLKKKKIDNCTFWEANYQIKRPGDYIFFVEPQPYWEPAEDCFIIHYSKVIVNAFGMEVGWDEEIGLKTEIIPLSRPYGLWTGNVFQGIVKVNGKPVPFSEVEIEYYNQGNEIDIPAEPMITQVVKADENGVFTYAMPKAGWWGFAALNEDAKKIRYNGEEKSIEIGAVLWVKTYDMR